MKAKIKDLPRGVGVGRVVSGRGNEYWRVRLGKKFTGGAVVHRDFTKLDEARSWIFGDAQKEKLNLASVVKLKQASGASAFTMSPAQLGEAASAIKRVSEWKMSLTDMLKLAERYRTPELGAMSVEKAISGCFAEKMQLGRSKQTLYDLKTRWRRFEKSLAPAKKAAIHTVGVGDVEKFLKKCALAPVGQRNMIRAISSLFSWCVKERVMAANPLLKWDFTEAKNVLKKDREPRILTIPEAENILGIAVSGCAEPMVIGKQKITISPGEMIPFVVLGLFGGLRPFEARRMRWEWVWWGDAQIENHDPHLDVPLTITKTGQGRPVPIEPVLMQWLLLHKKESGPVIPSGFERKFTMLSKLCWREAGWPEDVLRHSYASYLLARDKSAGEVAENLGHRDTTATLFRYYRKAVKFKADVAAFWLLTPERISGKPKPKKRKAA